MIELRFCRRARMVKRGEEIVGEILEKEEREKKPMR